MNKTSLYSEMIDTLYYIDEQRGDEDLVEFFEQFDYSVYLAIAEKTKSAVLQEHGWQSIEKAYNALVDLGKVD